MTKLKSTYEGFAFAREDAQAMIFFAIVLMTMALTSGLAIEGGRLFVEYRKMQAAVDMAALVGAQSLPCTSDCTKAVDQGYWCALTNYYGMGNVPSNPAVGCASVTTSPATVSNQISVTSSVPPATCSPYEAIDYGNDVGDTLANPSCKSTNRALSFYDYIEVQLTNNLLTIPVFNVPVQLTAHAVARHGVPSSKDYAVSQLDPNGSLTVSSAAFTFFVNGSSFANGTINISHAGTGQGCEGGFFTASSAGDPGGDWTYSGGVVGFAPPACYSDNNGTAQTRDNPTNYDNNLPPITDPYCTSISPPYAGNIGTDCFDTRFGTSSAPNCTDCTNNGWVYDVSTGKWLDNGVTQSITGRGANGDTYELFPGVYNNFGRLGNTQVIYLNPGYYTFKGNVDFDKGEVCVFGAPTCLSGTNSGQCGDTALIFYPQSAGGDNWYYKCSPYGFWDTKLQRPASSTGGTPSVTCPADGSTGTGSGPSCIPPTFWDTTKTNNLGINGGQGGVGSIPLNGVTINSVSTSSGAVVGSGSGPSALAFYIAAPNPCPGTGRGFTANSTSVSFNKGDPAAYYTYSAASTDVLAFQRGYTVSPIITGFGSQIYPSLDLSIAGECKPDTYEVWPGEMRGIGQHLHFSLFDRQNNFGRLNGNSGQSFTGVWYTPSATMDVRGGGAAGGGIPFITGQIIAWDIAFGGSGTVDLIYRPCNDKQDPCASGLGTQIIQ